VYNIDLTVIPVQLTYFITFIFGALVGSFLNVCILRIPKGESLVSPRSHCPECSTPIAFYDNIPLVSYLCLCASCRSCGARISARYFVVELLMALSAVGLHWRFGLGLAFVVGFVFTAALIVISFIDLDVRIVPDVISLPGIVLGFLFSLVGGYLMTDALAIVPTPLSSVLGILVGGGFLFLTAWAYERFTGVQGMGGGDIKLLAMIGAFLGWQSIPLTIFFASLAGSMIGVSVMIATGAGRRLALPFAPFLCAGALIYLFFGRQLMLLYL
jgi:leader peptidase (prepilin peptidase)/N-methyltransferase